MWYPSKAMSRVRQLASLPFHDIPFLVRILPLCELKPKHGSAWPTFAVSLSDKGEARRLTAESMPPKAQAMG